MVASDPRILFKKVDYTLDNLLTYIDLGDIGLPDIQRPFVWGASKVRDLFDSMYRGFPVGYLLFWANELGNGGRQIGKETKGHVPNLLIVDGQQRLTSLYAVFRGKEVVDDDYRPLRIAIAFRPRDGRFDVTDIAIRRDPEWIPDISELWASGKPIRRVVNEFIERLQSKRELTDEDEDAIAHNLDRLFDLQKYPFTALEIASNVNEEQVADIFVRINSQGVKLNQGDFILTLLSVFWDDGRAQLEQFCREARLVPSQGAKPSPFNHFVQPDPDQLLRVSVAYGFRRGRLKSVYQLLRGKDLETDQFSGEHREQQFSVLRDAQARVLDLTSWHQFFGALISAGFRSGDMIGSKNTLMYAYAFYLLGRIHYRVPEHALQRVVGRWFFFTTITSRYIGSFETQVESDLALLRDASAAEDFVEVLEKVMAGDLTDDFWGTTLPTHLETSGFNSPYLYAYLAAQNKLGAPVLFSSKRVAELLDPMLKAKMKSTNQHHLFPKAWLDGIGISAKRDVNQVANLAVCEWGDNLAISDSSPRDYVPVMKSRMSDEAWGKMNELHALPNGWETMQYDQFLDARRPLMAALIRRAYQSL